MNIKQIVFLLLVICTLNATYTIRGIYIPKSIANINVSNSNYLNTGNKGSYKMNTAVNDTIGIGFEAVLFDLNKNIEFIGGGEYLVDRSMPTFSGNAYLNGNDLGYFKNEVGIGTKIQITSIYGKIKGFLNDIATNEFAPYFAVKIVYNMVSFKTDSGDFSAKLNNGLGWGLSAGAVIFNKWDAELSLDRIGSTMTYDDGFDSFDGEYLMYNISGSLGYRF